MSLIEQLRRLATPVAASYAPDSVRRKSLIYEDPSKVDTLLCYQESLAAFERMCKLDEIFIGFRQTIFAETSCHLEICNLFVDEKFKLDNEIRRFLCYTSPFLKHYDAIRMLEWLVHKFQVHTHFVEDLIRCVIPYHETGLFAKFLQLLDFSSVNTEFRWLEPYAQCGRCLSRKELVRACFRQPGLVPFISSLMVNAVKCYQGLPDQSKLNDLTNFFLSTVVALCDTGMADERIAQVLGTLQHVLRVGLRASDCAPFQSAACLAVLRFSMKLQLNPDLVLDWIQCLLKKTRPTQTWESLRVITQLMRTQHIATLPEKLATRHAALLSTLPESQRKLIEQEEERLLDDVDVNQLAHAAALTAEVQAATVTMDVSAPPEDSALCISAIDLTSTKRTYSDTELLSACVNEVQLAHAILAALPETSRCCLFHEQNPTCVCPKMPGFSKDQNSWLTDLLLAGVLSKPATAGKSSKLEVRRARRVLHFAGLAAKAHVKTVQSLSTAPQTRASTSPRRSRATLSKAQCILEDGLDQGLPLLLTCLIHRSSAVRLDAFNLLSQWILGLVDSHWTPSTMECSRLSHLFQAMTLNLDNPIASTDRVAQIWSDQTAELLRGDPLPKLTNAAPALTSVCVRLLLSEHIPRPDSQKPISARASTCWAHGLPLLNEQTVADLFSIPDTCAPEHMTGWSAFLELVRSTAPAYSILHTLSIAVLNANFFHSLRGYPRPFGAHLFPTKSSPSLDLQHTGSGDAQLLLLSSLCDLANRDSPNYAATTALFDQLSLDLTHFDYLLLKLDASRPDVGDTERKPLLARVNEKREARRRSTRQSITNSLDTHMPTAEQSTVQTNRMRLRLLSTLLSVLTESVGRLRDSCANSKSIETEKTDAVTTLSQNTPNKAIPISPLCDLITPLINHLIGILSFEQQSAQTERTEHPTEDASSGSSDSESDNETGPSDQPILSLSTTISADLDADADLTRSSQSECPRTLLRQCCYRILVCLTAILAEANRHRPRAKRRATRLSPGFSITSPGVQTGAGESGMLASLLLATVNPVFHCLTVFPDWHALHQQVLLCIIELTNLCPVVLSQRLINLVQWTANNKQFMRLDNVHTLALLGRLVVVAVPALIRSSTDQTKAGLQVLLLFVDGMPNLANRLPRRRLAFYTGLVRGLAQVTGPLALDYASLGQSRSTGKADPKAKKAERQRQRELFSRWQENWVASWLWTMSLVFLNRNWTDESAANDVVPLLINLHGQFTWDTQVSAWYECLAFLSWLYKNAGNSIVAESEQSIRSKRCHTGTPNKKPELVDTEIAPPIKRRRTTSNSKSSGDIAEPDVKELPELICPANFNSPHITQSLLSILFHSGLEPDLVSNSSGPTLTSASTWALTGRAVQLLTTLLADPVYMDKIQQAASDPLGLGAVYGRLVEQSVQLMIGAAATLTKQKSSASKATSTPEDSTSILADGAKETLSGLQKVLIQIHDSVTGSIFVRMISDLFDTVDRGLRRKALELLAAKLTSLVVNCPPMPILDSKNPNALSQKILCRGKLPKRQPKPGLDLVLEAGLVQFTAQLASHYKLSESDGTKSITESGDTGKTTTGLFSSSFSRQSLACLRDLAKLLADRYPGEFSRTMDILISHPTAWWPVLPPSTEHKALDLRLSEIRGSGFAEARSLVCLFFVECLQRLPWQSMCPEASATTQRLRYLVRFALDHVITSCQLDTMPSLTLASLSNIQMAALVSGSVHSRDQHLQAGLTLLCNLMELAVVHGLVQSNSTTLPSSVISSSGARISWLDLDQSDQSTVAPGSLTSSYQLPQFIFRLSQIDLASATGANPERSSSTLRQVQELNKRMRILLPHLAEVHSTLSCVIRIAQFAQTNTDLTLIHGCLMFAREFAESICAAAESAKPGALSCAQLRHELIQYGVTQPDQLYNVLVSLLETCEYVLPHLSDPVPLLADLHTSVGALIAVLPLDSIVRFLQRLLDWTTSPVSPRDTVLRLTALFHILSDLHARLKAEDFVELSRQLSLVDYLVVAFTVAVGQKRKTVLKLSTRLNLKKCFELYVTGTESDGLKLAQAALTCAQRWLSAEHESNMCLDVASSGGSVLEFPISLIALLDTNASSSNHLPPLTEEQLVPTLNAFIEAASGDEALLRPMGCALSTRILHSTHWRTRLSAIRMLQKSFDYLTSGDQSSPDTAQHTGVAGCLVSDTLSALSEALEDDHPEVEAAANRLFAELERSGLTGNSKRTAM